MDLQTCLKKMQLVGVLAFATVDSEGAPQIRNISAIHYEENARVLFLPQEVKISVKNCWKMAEYRFYVTLNTKR